MSQLQDNLTRILNEKRTKIKAENILKGVQVFDINGTVEVGMTPAEEYECEELAKQILNNPTERLYPIAAANFLNNETLQLNENYTLNIPNVICNWGKPEEGWTNVFKVMMYENNESVQKIFTESEWKQYLPYITVYLDIDKTTTNFTYYKQSNSYIMFTKERPKYIETTYDGKVYKSLDLGEQSSENLIFMGGEYEDSSVVTFRTQDDSAVFDVHYHGYTSDSENHYNIDTSYSYNEGRTRISLDDNIENTRATLVLANYTL